MIACINTLDPTGAAPLPVKSPAAQATKVRHITLFAAARRASTIHHHATRKLSVQFAEAAFIPAIRNHTK